MKKNLTHKEILAYLRSHKGYLQNEFGVVNIGLFGSYAKGKQTTDSDIDFLVEFKEARFDWLAGLQLYLEKSLSRPIELVRKGKKVNSRFSKRIEKEVIYA